MALPKNKGIRRLTVEGIEYYWKVEDDFRDPQGLIVTVGIVSKPHKRFVFDFRFNYKKLKQFKEPNSLLTSVTPNLIKASIVFAKQHLNWHDNPSCYFKFETGIFRSFSEQ